MAILITGSSGLIGNYLKNELKNNYDIIELDYNNNPSIDATNEQYLLRVFN